MRRFLPDLYHTPLVKVSPRECGIFFPQFPDFRKRLNCYSSVKSSPDCYSSVTSPHLTHFFIHIIPTWIVHNSSVNRLCRQFVLRGFPACFFDGGFFIDRRFSERPPLRKGLKTLFHIIHNRLCGQSSTSVPGCGGRFRFFACRVFPLQRERIRFQLEMYRSTIICEDYGSRD